MARVNKKLGSWVLPRELKNIGLENTPWYDPKETETQDNQSFPQLVDKVEPMTEVTDQYIGAEVLLPRGN